MLPSAVWGLPLHQGLLTSESEQGVPPLQPLLVPLCLVGPLQGRQKVQTHYYEILYVSVFAFHNTSIYEFNSLDGD